ncbi:MAG TPA: DUF2255 family protein [Vicinamibacterales bacterium]|nr:DUF2255 family protein [Vicinamibacterales bacterium]
MAAVKRFPARLLGTLDETKYLWIRAGNVHRFIGIWAVVVDGRVFVRSWTLKPEGWHRTFQTGPAGAIRIGHRVIRIRAVRTRGERILRAVDRAYAGKYTTASNLKYVRGLSRGRRRASTTELLPR